VHRRINPKDVKSAMKVPVCSNQVMKQFPSSYYKDVKPAMANHHHHNQRHIHSESHAREDGLHKHHHPEQNLHRVEAVL
jgi:hypothetical protein